MLKGAQYLNPREEKEEKEEKGEQNGDENGNEVDVASGEKESKQEGEGKRKKKKGGKKNPNNEKKKRGKEGKKDKKDKMTVTDLAEGVSVFTRRAQAVGELQDGAYIGVDLFETCDGQGTILFLSPLFLFLSLFRSLSLSMVF